MKGFLIDEDGYIYTIEDIKKLQTTVNVCKQENKKLKEKINTYENPEDLTLMFMYCDEKAKDKIKELKDNWNKLKEWMQKELVDSKATSGYSFYLKSWLDKIQEIEGGMNE